MDIEAQRCQEHGLSHWDYIILSDACEHPRTSQREVAERVRRSPSRIVGDVESLRARGLLLRTAAEHDRRVNCLELTDGGRELTRAVQRAIRADEREMLHRLSGPEQGKLRDLLTKALDPDTL